MVVKLESAAASEDSFVRYTLQPNNERVFLIFNFEKPDVFNTYGGNLPYILYMILDVLCPTGVITLNYIETA